MKRACAILGGIVLVTVLAYFLLSPHVSDSSAPRIRFPFVGYMTSPTGSLAVFDTTNQTGPLVMRFAFIQQLTATGWVTVSTNVPIIRSPAGMALPVPSIDVPLRFVFDVEEGASGLRYAVRRLFGGTGRKGSSFVSIRKGFVTNEASAVSTP